MKNYLKGKAISDETIRQYLNEKFNSPQNVSIERRGIIDGVPALLQNDYGLDGDCTITSMTAILNYVHNTGVQRSYDYLEHIDMQYGYDGIRGTNPLLIPRIMKEAERRLEVSQTSWKSHLGKGLCFNFETVVKNVKKAHPMILNIPNDGRDYYGSHSITVIGYLEYKVNGKRQRFVMVYDNWHTYPAYVDYEILSVIASLVTY